MAGSLAFVVLAIGPVVRAKTSVAERGSNTRESQVRALGLLWRGSGWLEASPIRDQPSGDTKSESSYD